MGGNVSLMRRTHTRGWKRPHICLAKNTSFLFTYLFFHPIYCPRTMLSSSLPVVTTAVVAQIRGYIAGLPPPSPLRYLPSFLSREQFSIFFPRRLASNCTYPRCKALSAVDPFCFLHVYKYNQISTRWESNSRTKARSIRR